MLFALSIASVSYIALKNQSQSPKMHNPSLNAQTSWEAWKRDHSKQYSSLEEDTYRKEIYLENRNYVEQSNQDALKRGSSLILKVNKFSDMLPEEWRAKMFGIVDLPLHNTSNVDVELSNQAQQIVDAAAQDSGTYVAVDWRDKNIVTPIKNQGNCGSCWAFGTVGALEGLHALTQHSLLSFSEQQLVDCAHEFFTLNGCNGGTAQTAFIYTENNGITLESEYPYLGTVNTCYYKQSSMQAFRNKGWKEVLPFSDTHLMAAIQQQPVAVAIQATLQSFMQYSSGIYDDPKCTILFDHIVLAVGYGYQSGQGYYIVKNSWGTDWGENGYIQMAIKGGLGTCGIQTFPTYPTM